jgi:hypothetical protein
MAVAIAVGGTIAFANDKDRAARQAELGAACETACSKRLVADRQKLVAASVGNAQGSQGECQADFSNYGERSGSRPPLYYDLPECEAAIDFHKFSRSTR